MSTELQFLISMVLGVLIYIVFTYYKIYYSNKKLGKYVMANKHNIEKMLSNYNSPTTINGLNVYLISKKDYHYFKNRLLIETNYNYYLKELIVNYEDMNELFIECKMNYRIVIY